MKILERLASSLFNPNKVIYYKDDKKWITVVFFFVLSFILMIPNICIIFLSSSFDYEQELAIRAAFNNADPIPYKITDGELEYVGEDGTTEKDFYLVSTDDFLIYFTTKSTITDTENTTSSAPRIIFSKTGVNIGTYMLSEEMFTYDDYADFEGLDFTKSIATNSDFWTQAFKVVNNVLNDYQKLIYFFEVVVVIMQCLLTVLVASLIIAFFGRFGSTKELSFGCHWKLVIYYTTPFVIGNVLGALFNFSLLVYAGLILTVIYSYKINYNGSFGGKDNEL